MTEIKLKEFNNFTRFVPSPYDNSFVGYGYSQLKKMTSGAHEGYMGAKRKEMVKHFGYDTKNAAHLVRLLRMGIEFLQEGRLYVERPDAAQLLEIKWGEWSLEQVKAEADRLFKSIEEARIESSLPEKPDRDKISELCVEIVRTSYAEREQVDVDCLWQ